MNLSFFARCTFLKLVFSLLISGCVSATTFGKVSKEITKKNYKYTESGLASFYAKKFNKQKTANGETYKPEKYTAAHSTLPFGTLVLVRKKSSGRFVIVRINDRGPHIPGRIVDLSYSSAEKLGLLRTGVARVELYVVPEKSSLLAYNSISNF